MDTTNLQYVLSAINNLRSDWVTIGFFVEVFNLFLGFFSLCMVLNAIEQATKLLEKAETNTKEKPPAPNPLLESIYSNGQARRTEMEKAADLYQKKVDELTKAK